jgi:hypothetical protein
MLTLLAVLILLACAFVRRAPVELQVAPAPASLPCSTVAAYVREWPKLWFG